MGLIWTPQQRTRQPQLKVSLRVGLFPGGTPVFLWVPAWHITANQINFSIPTIGGSVPSTVVGEDGIYARTTNLNRLTWSEKAQTTKFTAIYRGFLNSVSTSYSQHVFGQFSQNTASGAASSYDWSIYESTGGDAVYFFCGNGSSVIQLTDAAGTLWRSKKLITVAVSFDNGIPRMSVNGGPTATGSSLSGGAITSSYGLASGGYWSGYSSYDPLVQSSLGLVVNGYAASAQQLQRLSENPWQIFAPDEIPVWFTDAGSDLDITATRGDAAAVGYTATVDAQTTIAASLGTAAATGYAATVDRQLTIAATCGTAAGVGYSAGVAINTDIAAARGNAAAVGYAADVTFGNDLNITASAGQAAAIGYAADLDLQITIAATRGDATALGYAATITDTDPLHGFTQDQLDFLVAHMTANLGFPSAADVAAAVWAKTLP